MRLMFEHWDLGIDPITTRSRLYSLAPIGVGTPLVESLSGYVARLAGAHAVSAGNLVCKQLPCCVEPDAKLALTSYSINGVGRTAKRWVEGLEEATLRSDLRYLTLLPFERLLPKPFLFRQVRAWCPACYGLMASRGKPIYEPLLWCLKLVEVCSRHHGIFATACPHCLRSQRPLCGSSRPGFCSRCGLWLGEATPHPAPGAAPTEYQHWLAQAIGELLANAPKVPPELLRDRARSALWAYANAFAEGNQTAVADVVGVRKVFHGWFKGAQLPRIDTLLRTWYQLKLPVACFFDDTYPRLPAKARAQRALEIRESRGVAPKRTREQIRSALQAALHEQPAPSLTELARRLGYAKTTRLSEVGGDLSRQIVLNHRRSGRSHWWKRKGAKPICELSRVQQVLEDYLGSDTPIPPLSHIAGRLGYAIDQSLREKFPDLTHALSARIAEQKRACVMAIEPALEQALLETPPPALEQVAVRLGFSAASVLKAHAPVLYEKVKTRWLAYRQERRLELRQKLEAALTEDPPPSLRAIYSRLGVTESIVSTSFPDLRQAIGLRHRLFQRQQAQARRDAVRAEIREIVRNLLAAGICPSLPRVTSLLRSGSLREWHVVGQALNDARRELMPAPKHR